MPVKVTLNGKEELSTRNKGKPKLTNDNLKLVVDPNFYVDSLKVTE
jgi:hypothetical protein